MDLFVDVWFSCLLEWQKSGRFLISSDKSDGERKHCSGWIGDDHQADEHKSVRACLEENQGAARRESSDCKWGVQTHRNGFQRGSSFCEEFMLLAVCAAPALDFIPTRLFIPSPSEWRVKLLFFRSSQHNRVLLSIRSFWWLELTSRRRTNPERTWLSS